MCSSDSSELNDLVLEEIVDAQMTDDLHKQIDEIMEQVFCTTITDCEKGGHLLGKILYSTQSPCQVTVEGWDENGLFTGL